MTVRTFNLRQDPNIQPTYANRNRIIVRDLARLCAPGLHD